MQARAGALEGMPHIPAMTTEAERALYYRIAREGAARGAVVELGAWLGASSAWIAAGMRDSGTGAKAHVYDRFVSKPGHADKVKAFYAHHGGEGDMALGDCERQFRENLGPLVQHVEVHRGEIASIEWSGGPIAVLVSDAPKRVPEISAVLTRLGSSLVPGCIMAWQDFCHFPSYEIPACLYRLGARIEFVEAVVPGTTLAFRVVEQWGAEDVTVDRLSLARWTPEEIAEAWYSWLGFVPEQKRGLFQCGRAMFLCDTDHPDLAVQVLEHVHRDHAAEILPKWRYLHEKRPGLVTRYRPLFDYLAKAGALC